MIYVIQRKEDGYSIMSKDITFSEKGIWINDDLETNDTNLTIFIPYHNILQVTKYDGD